MTAANSNRCFSTISPSVAAPPQTPDRERKRMVRLLLEEVTLIKRDEITVHVRFQSGVAKTLTLPLPLSAPELRKTDEAVIQVIGSLARSSYGWGNRGDLNQRGCFLEKARPFHRGIILHLRDAII